MSEELFCSKCGMTVPRTNPQELEYPGNYCIRCGAAFSKVPPCSGDDLFYRMHNCTRGEIRESCRWWEREGKAEFMARVEEIEKRQAQKPARGRKRKARV